MRDRGNYFLEKFFFQLYMLCYTVTATVRQ